MSLYSAPLTTEEERFDPEPDFAPPPIEPRPLLDPDQIEGATDTARILDPDRLSPSFSRLQLAFHEAGHAVCLLAFGALGGDAYASVSDQGGDVFIGSDADEENTFGDTAELQATAIAATAVLVAGPQCELLFRGFYEHIKPPAGKDYLGRDYARAREALRNAGLTHPNWLRTAEAVARNKLTTHWGAVWLIGHHLFRRGSLTADELLRLYRRGPAFAVRPPASWFPRWAGERRLNLPATRSSQYEGLRNG
jgi:hypothetical protein